MAGKQEDGDDDEDYESLGKEEEQVCTDVTAAPGLADEPLKPCPKCTYLNNPSSEQCTLCKTVFESAEKYCLRCTFSAATCCFLCRSVFPLASSSTTVLAPETACHACNTSYELGCYRLQDCSHSLCRNCIVKQIADSLVKHHENENVLFMGVSCPVEGCEMVLNRQDIRVAAGMEVLRYVDSSIYEYIIRSSEAATNKLAIVWNNIQNLGAAYESRINLKGPKVLIAPERPAKYLKMWLPNGVDAKTTRRAATKARVAAIDAALVIEKADVDLGRVLFKLAEDINHMVSDDGSVPFLVTVLICCNKTVWNVLGWLLRNDSILDIAEHSELYFLAFAVVKAFVRPELLSMLCSDGPGYDFWTEGPHPGSLFVMFEKLYKQAMFILKIHSNTSATGLQGHESALVAEIADVFEELKGKIKTSRLSLANFSWVGDADNNFKTMFPRVYRVVVAGAKDRKGKHPAMKGEEEYVTALKPIQFGMADFLQSHYFRGEANFAMDKPSRARRISKELAVLATSLPLEYSSSIHVRIDNSRMDLVKAVIIGPHGTPYQDGIFLFDIFMDKSYPNSAPKVKYLTTGGGRVQFNPYLYDSGHVCLSLLETWHGPSWEPGKSTVLQVLVSLQSLVFVSDPLFNEQYLVNLKTSKTLAETYKNSKATYNKEQMYNTLVDSILPALRQPDVTFQDVIETHFRLKRSSIEQQCDEWGKLTLSCSFMTRRSTDSRTLSFHEAAMEVKKELARFDT